MIQFSEEMDGVEYINAYSKGKTDLGRYLSNFSAIDGGQRISLKEGDFKSIEGYWYYLNVHPCLGDKLLMDMVGNEAKLYGKELLGNRGGRVTLPDFEEKILQATREKLLCSTVGMMLYKELKLPIVHFYSYRGRIVRSDSNLFQIKYLNETLRKELGLDILDYQKYYPNKEEYNPIYDLFSNST